MKCLKQQFLKLFLETNEINGNIVFPRPFSHHATQFAQKNENLWGEVA